MKAVFKILAGGVGLAALAGAAPAVAQYYPGYGYGQPNTGVVGQVINQVLGGNQYGYGVNSQAAVQRCAAAVEQRINRNYNRVGYGGYGGYSGYGGYGGGYGYGQVPSGARVLGVTRIEQRSSGRLRVRGVATARAHATAYANPYGGGYGGAYGGAYGGYGGYGGGYAPQQTGELAFKCDIDYRGYITDIDLERNRYAHNPYGYRR
ncbi:MAG TPA: hypothetical protein VMN38_12560 [Sphingomicrobium sp.]|nr:hypothetical protein [Sphingomicrobium sp.]